MQFTFRCKCGVFVITEDPLRFKCRSCEPKERPFIGEKFRQTRMLAPPKKEKDDEDGKT